MPWDLLITVLSKITRKKSDLPVCCPHCGDRQNFIKWGFYCRYCFDDQLVHVQRYRCFNTFCPYKTFSILPHAFLPIVRASLCMLTLVLSMYEQGIKLAHIARQTGSSWQRVKRWVQRALSVRDWIKREYGLCRVMINQWSSLTRDFSFAFYPDRWG